MTQEAYQRVMGSNPSYLKGAQRPVESINWTEAGSYCGKAGMRLPTEAEWEYAARAGSTGARYGELGEVAWYVGNSGSQTHEVRLKKRNARGLYDMLGNVWEWTADRYPGTGMHVLRGGSWYSDPRNVRVSYRNRSEPAIRSSLIGVRCAGELP